MFVDDDVDLLFPPLPLPLDWSSKIAVPGTSSVMSPRAIAGIRIATSTPATQSDRRLPTDLDMCRPPGGRIDVAPLGAEASGLMQIATRCATTNCGKLACRTYASR